MAPHNTTSTFNSPRLAVSPCLLFFSRSVVLHLGTCYPWNVCLLSCLTDELMCTLQDSAENEPPLGSLLTPTPVCSRQSPQPALCALAEQGDAGFPREFLRGHQDAPPKPHGAGRCLPPSLHMSAGARISQGHREALLHISWPTKQSACSRSHLQVPQRISHTQSLKSSSTPVYHSQHLFNFKIHWRFAGHNDPRKFCTPSAWYTFDTTRMLNGDNEKKSIAFA